MYSDFEEIYKPNKLLNLNNNKMQALSFKNACCATNSTSQDIQMCCRCALYITVYNFTRFRCAENCTPQDHFRCGMMCYRTSQKTRPETELVLFLLINCGI